MDYICACLQHISEDFPDWSAKHWQETCSRATVEPTSYPLSLSAPWSHLCMWRYLLLWFPERLNGIARGDAVDLKAVLIYASSFCNHRPWSNIMPTKSALFASLYEYNLWQIFNSCNLPETSTPWRQAQIGNGSLTHPSGLIIIILSTSLILYTH